MLEKIMGLVKDQVTNSVAGISGIPEDKKAETIETTAHSLMDGLKKYATPGAVSSLLGMGGSSPLGGGAGKSMESGIVSALTSKVGLNPSVAQKIATTVIPMVTSLLKNKVNDDKEP